MTLSYCTNIHPGESWREIMANLRTHLPTVKERFSPGRPFPLALRLSNRAAWEIDAEDSARFLDWCREGGFFVATLNGFPFGPFHGLRLKEGVYLPDWRDPARRRYTERCADLLASWLPEGGRSSISTVPIGFRGAIAPGEMPDAQGNLTAALEHCHRLAGETGREILLALEPEPGCLLETTADVIRLFEVLRLPPHLFRHCGVCFDCCHQALQFEEPAASLDLLARAGIRIGQVQVSSALRIEQAGLLSVARFAEPQYLHQSVGRRRDGSLVRFNDLPEAIRGSLSADCQEWRVHFHLPVFLDKLQGSGTTRFFLEEILPLFAPEVPLEVETYTWNVLPADLRQGSVTESIIRELHWVEDHLTAKSPAVSRPPTRDAEETPEPGRRRA